MDFLILFVVILAIIGTITLGVYRRTQRSKPWAKMLRAIEGKVDSLNHDPGPRHFLAKAEGFDLEVEDYVDWIEVTARWSSENRSKGDVYTTLQPPKFEFIDLLSPETAGIPTGETTSTGHKEFDNLFRSNFEGEKVAQQLTKENREDLIWFAQQSKGVHINDHRIAVAARKIEDIPSIIDKVIEFCKQQDA